jgi:hypothetical protein
MAAKPMRLWLLVLAGCGRIGFALIGGSASSPGDAVITGDAVPANMISITVLEPAEATNAGQPLAGATVIVDDANGRAIATSDAQGSVVAPVAGTATVHVVFSEPDPIAGTDWRVTSIYRVGGGTAIVLGGRPGPTVSGTLVPPGENGATKYGAVIPPSCGESFQGTNVGFDLVASCAGMPMDTTAIAYDGSGNELEYLPLPGLVVPANGSVMPGGTWSKLDVYSVTVQGAPAGALAAAAHLGAVVAPGELEDLAEASGPPGTALSVAAPPGATGAFVTANSSFTPIGSNAVQFSETQRYIPGAVASGATLAADLLPFVTSVASDGGTQTVSWTSDGVGTASLVAADVHINLASSGYIEWSMYAPPDVTTFTFPSLPPQVAAATPGPTATWLRPDFAMIDATGLDAAAMLGFVDLDWLRWFAGPGAHMPAGGVATSALLEAMM